MINWGLSEGFLYITAKDVVVVDGCTAQDGTDAAVPVRVRFSTLVAMLKVTLD